MLVSLRFVLAAPLLALAVPAMADPCRSESFEGTAYTVCSFDLAETDLRIFWQDPDGAEYGTFTALVGHLEAGGQRLAFAMNGGMYEEDFSPLGLHIENGRELAPANTKDAPAGVVPVPNFYKKPNGIFYVGDDGAGVLTTERFLALRPDADFATQSGPMLVIDGAIHPAFIPGSSDRKQRNGVGVTSPTQVHFAISDGTVNFHDFARFFRDGLGCRTALFLDGGSAPGLYAPELGRNDAPGHGGYGPIIGVVVKAPGTQ
jgi:uncharacterized protein YigE (DUF2233 family)